jgi:hypothetical protein
MRTSRACTPVNQRPVSGAGGASRVTVSMSPHVAHTNRCSTTPVFGAGRDCRHSMLPLHLAQTRALTLWS